MVRLLHELILEQVNRRSDAAAIVHRQTVLDYAGLAQGIQAVAHGLLMFGLKRAERIASNERNGSPSICPNAWKRSWRFSARPRPGGYSYPSIPC